MRSSAIVRVLLAAMLLAPAAAAQDPPPRDPVDDASVRWGPIGLTPVINLRDVGRDNNVFNESTSPKSDFTATISPKLDVLAHPGPLLLTVSTTSDYIYYQTYASERAANIGSSVRADFTFGPVRPSFSASGGNTKDRVNREIDARARHRDRAYGAGVRVQLVEGVSVTGGVRQSSITYDEDAVFRGESLAENLDEQMRAVDASVGVALTPLTSVSVAVSMERDRFDLSPERDSDTLRIMPSVSFSPLAMLNGSAAFGYRRFTPLDPRVPDYRGFVASLSLGTTLHERHRIDAAFGRDVQYSYEEADVYYVETSIQGTWTWQVTGPLDLRLSGSRARMRYPTRTDAATDEDFATTYGAGVSWRLRPTLRAGVNADWRGRESERSADREYDNRRIYATVTWGKQ